MKSLRFILLILLFLFGQIAQAQQVFFEHLDIKDGLSQISVTSLEQDQLGVMWIGTRDGLNRYNGYEMEVFRHQRDDSTTLVGNNIRDIQVDDEFLWVLCPEGISRFDTRTEKFINFANENVKCLFKGEQTLWVGTTQGLFYLDTLSGKYQAARDIFSPSISISELYEDGVGKIWIGTKDQGLFRFNPKNGALDSLLKGTITSIYESENGNLWVGTADDGVYCLKEERILLHLSHEIDNSNSLSHNVIRDITEDNTGRLWFGTFYGVSVFNPRNSKFTNFYQSDKRPFGLSHNSIYTLFKDQRGSIWIGTYFGGLNIYNPEFNVFKYFVADTLKHRSISYRVIGTMLEDDQKNMWIATEGGGLNFYDRQKGTFKYYRMGGSDRDLSHKNVKSLYLDNSYKLWIGTHLGGLNVLDLKTQRIKKYQRRENQPGGIPSNVISAILPLGDNLLLGTNAGVILYNRKTDSFSRFFENKKLRDKIGSKILALMMDNEQRLWIGSETKGLTVFDMKSGEVSHYRHISSDNESLGANCVYQIYQDHMRRIWVATSGGGLNLFHSQGFKIYNRKDHGLPSDFIYGIAESRFGFLWIATSKGISRFDVEDEKFRNYDFNNGFPLVEINERGLYITTDGEVFVGGIHGMVAFKEKELQNRVEPNPLYLTSLSVNNKYVHPGDESGILSQALSFTSEIHLDYTHNVVSFEFASLNYLKTNKSKYLYRLEGVDIDWVDAGYRRSVTYTNLKPGNYVFYVKENKDRGESEIATAELSISIAPPFYNTWWAYLIYVGIMAFILIYINRVLISKALLEDKLRMGQVEKDRINELNQSKLRFFTNISHEFRTPLTLIFGLLESVLGEAKLPTKAHNKILVAYKNSFRLKNLIDELLEFRKQELGHTKLKVNEYDFVSFVSDIFHSFKEYAIYRKIDYKMVCHHKSVMTWFDARQMEKVFYNLLSNAFKFTPESGSVYFLVDVNEKELRIKVMDSGKGMEQEELDKIFDRYYQVDNLAGGESHHIGSGIGLALSKGIVEDHGGHIHVESKRDNGSCFEVVLPLGAEHFTDEQICTKATFDNSRFAQVSYIPLELKQDQQVNVGDKCGDNLSGEDEETTAIEYTILIVEDNSEVRDFLRESLCEEFHVLEAENGKQGYDMALEHQPQLIISDVMMPVMTGTEMCKLIKSELATSHIPIILLTAKSALEYEVEGLEIGADDYITKPFNLQLLQVRCRNLIRLRKSLQEKYRTEPGFQVKKMGSNSLDAQLLEKAVEVVESHLDNPKFDVNTFASEMCLGRTNLYGKIKAVTGQTPNEFILTIRLQKAARTLKENPSISISDVAYSVGFSTPRYFSKCFSDHFGITPSKFSREK